MAGGWDAILIFVGVAVVAIGAVLTARHGVIEYLFLDFRRDERPAEFWLVLSLMTAGALAVLYALLSLA